MKNPYILPKEVKPVRYNLEITPNFKDLTFTGKESIELKILKDTKEISLNIKDLEITSAKIKNNKLKKILHNKKYQKVTFFFNKTIKKGSSILYLEFKSKIREDLRGFYKSVYSINKKEKILLTTQFEPNDARKCFPCFDEPGLKSIFSLTLKIPDNLNAVSNMPIKKQFGKDSAKTVIFEETPMMSTYLLAFVIGELEYVEGKTNEGTIVRILTTPGKKDKAKFPLDVAIKSLEFYNKYFSIPYPLPKLDLIAIPDFESGAMENWGLITYRETLLLFDEKNSSAGVKQAVVHTINHEIAHQWFGNLVTMKWWNDLWLNEGFASWIEYKATDSLFPEFDIWTQYLTELKIPAFYLDTLSTSHPIEVNVVNPDEINEIFDAISYNKGSAIIRMLEQYLGEEVFEKGLQYYLNEFKYSSATTEDLWKCLQKISKKPVKSMMDTWTKQMGYPLISASIKGDKVILEQKKFSYLNKKDNALWHIPIAIQEDNKIRYCLLKDKRLGIKLKDNALLNPNQVGFYRIKYDNKLSKDLTNIKLGIADKIGLQNDVFALARGCYIPINDYLELASTYKYEDNYAIWNDISFNLKRIKLLFAKTHQSDLNAFIQDLFSEIFKKVGWQEKPDEEHTTILLRANVIATIGFSEHKEVLEKATVMFYDHLKGKKISPNLRSVVYSLAAFNDSRDIYNQLRGLYLKETLAEEKLRLLSALSMFKQEEILRETLNFSLSKNVRAQDIIYTFYAIANNEYVDDLAWDFLKENWKEFDKRYREGHVIPNLIKSTVMMFDSLKKIKEIKEFFKTHKAPSAKRAIQQSLEIIKINHNFLKYNKGLAI